MKSQPATSISACLLCNLCSTGLWQGSSMKCHLLSSCWWGPLAGLHLWLPASRVSAAKAADLSTSPQSKSTACCLVHLRTSQRLKRSAVQGPQAGEPSATSTESRCGTLTTYPFVLTAADEHARLTPSSAARRQRSACEAADWRMVGVGRHSAQVKAVHNYVSIAGWHHSDCQVNQASPAKSSNTTNCWHKQP